MITFFSAPRAFEGVFNRIQRNSIQSWLRACPDGEVILFGNEKGTSEVSEEYGIKHVTDLKYTALGTPLMSSIFEKAYTESSKPLLCQVNADIMLLPETRAVASYILTWKNRFLVTGRRWNLNWDQAIDFSDAAWSRNVKRSALAQNDLFTPYGLDYFIYPKGFVTQIPPFVAGRPSFDNWMIFNGRILGGVVIDATEVIMAVHQNHPPRFMSKTGELGGASWEAEAKYNRRLAHTDRVPLFSTFDATHVFKRRKIVPAVASDRNHFIRYVRTSRHVSPITPCGFVSTAIALALDFPGERWKNMIKNKVYGEEVS